MRNYLNYWSNVFIQNGLKWIKLVIGLGICFALAISVDVIVGILFFGWVLTDSLIQK